MKGVSIPLLRKSMPYYEAPTFMKGVSSVIAVILLLLITIALVGISYNLFIGIQQSTSEQAGNASSTQTESIRESFRIVQTDNNKVYIRNAGTLDMAPPSFLVNNVPATGSSACTKIAPQQTCEFTIGVPSTGTYELIVAGRSVNLETELTVATVATTTTTTLPPKRIFVTSQTYNGNLGGLAGADTICNSLANAASLGGTWVAWLSTSTVDAKTRILDTKYLRMDGALVANNLADLTDGTIANSIRMDEYGSTVSINQEIWTGTGSDGTKMNDNCNGWSSGNAGTSNFGSAFSIYSFWTSWSSTSCDALISIYCFEK